MSKLIMVVLLLLAASAVAAAAQENGATLPEPPKVKQGEVLEPDVTIIEQKDRTIEQYSINGHIYMIKITPSAGPPYYLYDLDGDGQMDVRRSSPMDIGIPQWVLFSW